MTNPLTILKKIGHQLDDNIFPRIMNGGIVTPGEFAVITSPWAEEKIDERQEKRRPETRPWTGPSGGQRQTVRGGTPGSAPPFVCADFKNQYDGELTAVNEAYPGTRVWHQNEGLWLLTKSSLLPGLWQNAVILTGIPYVRTRTVRSWGFWMGTPLRYPTWIGPRHTNFPDGSICAFEPSDGTWKLGDPLVVLLDIYTLWALRHLHLQIFQRWPGRQVAHFVHERLTEQKLTEFCGCGSDRLYVNCCQETDHRSDRVHEAIRFFNLGGGLRTPPNAVTTFIQVQDYPPEIKDLFPMVKFV
jgi:hypothetical protein